MDRELRNEILDEIKAAVEQTQGAADVLVQAKNWDGPLAWLKNTKLIGGLIEKVVVCVETIFQKGGVMTKEERIEYAVAILDKLIPAPGLLELVDGIIIRMLVNFAVDKLNAVFGHAWSDENKAEVLNAGAPEPVV